ncbi:fetuin B [Diretmus argenteus]
MKHCALLSLLLAMGCVCIHGAPVEQDDMEPASCQEAPGSALSAAGLALTKINEDRHEGYILSLHRLANANMVKHGDTGVVFYLTLDVVETDCHVLSKKRDCEARATHDTPVYGQCKAVIYISKVHRVVRLYKYNCEIRPVPAAKVGQVCPDCPSLIAMDDAEIQKTVSLSLEKYNKENGLANHFALLKVTRATSQGGMAVFYHAEFTIQETSCAKSSDSTKADNCPLMTCEFAHKGFCKASHSHAEGIEDPITVECDIYEPEASEKEKKLHLLGGETDHSHNDTHTDTVEHTHDGAHDHAHHHDHDHVHDHTKSHVEHDKTHTHVENSNHHHTHDHTDGRHAHDHSHDHGHGHDHTHAHHAKAHNHTGDSPNHHHDYKHDANVHTHEHDHEHALDHDHKHAHLHEHEHHHHHHDHEHETAPHDHPEGMVRMLPAMDQPMTLPSFPDQPAAGPEVGVVLPLIPDPQIPGVMEPIIRPFPTSVSAMCPGAVKEGANNLVVQLFAEDPMFKAAA